MMRGCLRCNSGRVSLASMLNALDLRAYAVEVGTHRGDFAASFLSRWSGRYLYCIDPWYNPEGYEDQATYLPVSRGVDRCQDYDVCVKAMREVDPTGRRYSLIKRLSLEAVEMFANESLDFVYVDADHTRPGIDNDLEAWWHKVKPTGLLAGHDIICPMEPEGGWGRYIQPAVMEFSARHGVDVWIVAEPTSSNPKEPNLFSWSYYFVKP